MKNIKQTGLREDKCIRDLIEAELDVLLKLTRLTGFSDNSYYCYSMHDYIKSALDEVIEEYLKEVLEKEEN